MFGKVCLVPPERHGEAQCPAILDRLKTPLLHRAVDAEAKILLAQYKRELEEAE